MPLMNNDSTDEVRVTVWQCIGCGKIEHPQPCIGVCQDRKIDLVYDDAYQDSLRREAAARRDVETLAEVLRQIAHITPRDGQWEASWKSLQKRAREALANVKESGKDRRHA